MPSQGGRSSQNNSAQSAMHGASRGMFSNDWMISHSARFFFSLSFDNSLNLTNEYRRAFVCESSVTRKCASHKVETGTTCVTVDKNRCWTVICSVQFNNRKLQNSVDGGCLPNIQTDRQTNRRQWKPYHRNCCKYRRVFNQCLSLSLCLPVCVCRFFCTISQKPMQLGSPILTLKKLPNIFSCDYSQCE